MVGLVVKTLFLVDSVSMPLVAFPLNEFVFIIDVADVVVVEDVKVLVDVVSVVEVSTNNVNNTMMN